MLRYFLLIILLLSFLSCPTTGDPVKVLNLLLSEDAKDPNVAIRGKFILAGVNIALSTEDPTEEIIELIDPSMPDSITSSVGIDGKVAAVALAPSTSRSLSEFNQMKLQFPSLVAFGAYITDGISPQWSNTNLFLHADPQVELLAIVKHVTVNLQAKRVALVRDPDSTNLATNINYLYSLLQRSPSLTTTNFSIASGTVVAELSKIVLFDPHAIIIYSSDNKLITDFIETAHNTGSVPSAAIFLTSMHFGAITELESLKVGRRIYFTTYAPSSKETKLPFVNTFNEEAAKYDGNVLNSNTAYETLTISGWIVGKTLVQLVRASRVDPADPYESQKMLQKRALGHFTTAITSDLPIGPFSGDCYQEPQDLLCNCNAGIKTIFLFEEELNKASAHLGSWYSLPPNACKPADIVLPMYANVLFMSNNEQSNTLASMPPSFVAARDAYALLDSNEIGVIPAVIQTDNELTDIITEKLFQVQVGPIGNPSFFSTLIRKKDILLMDPTTTPPSPRRDNEAVMYMMPTMDQQIFVFAKIVKETGYTAAVALADIPENDRERVGEIIEAAQEQIEVELEVASTVESTYQIVLVLSLSDATVESILSLLIENTDFRVMVLFEELSIFYNEIKEAFEGAPTSVQSRLYICLNIPVWTDFSAGNDAANRVLADYHKVYKTKDDTSPLTLQAWYNAAILRQLMSCDNEESKQPYIECLYKKGSFPAGSTVFQGYSRSTSGSSTFQEQNVNYGAIDLLVYPFQSILEGKTVFVFGPFEHPNLNLPPIETTSEAPIDPPETNTSTKTTTTQGPNPVLVISVPFLLGSIASLLAVLILLLIVLLVFCCWKEGRDNGKAPQNPQKPVTLMFTDIQSSTSLWALDPEQMAKAMEAHHEIIRKEIAKFECYEVKTIGDSFMIASHDSYKMVQLAMAIQDALYLHDWETDVFDKFYVQESKAKNNIKPYMASTINETINSEAYTAIWNGIRVRSGMHTGLCDIRFDEVTKGYDYYGDTVNTAARTESSAAGGQILVTQSTWDDISEHSTTEEQDSIPVKNAGLHNLRGVPHPVQMYHIDIFPERDLVDLSLLESGEPVPCAEEESNMINNDEDVEISDKSSNTVFSVIEGALSAFSLKKKYAYIEPLLQQWGINTTTKHAKYTREDFDELMRRFANRTGKVFAQREVVKNVENDPGMADLSPEDRAAELINVVEEMKHAPEAVVQQFILGSPVKPVSVRTRGTSPTLPVGTPFQQVESRCLFFSGPYVSISHAGVGGPINPLHKKKRKKKFDEPASSLSETKGLYLLESSPQLRDVKSDEKGTHPEVWDKSMRFQSPMMPNGEAVGPSRNPRAWSVGSRGDFSPSSPPIVVSFPLDDVVEALLDLPLNQSVELVNPFSPR